VSLCEFSLRSLGAGIGGVYFTRRHEGTKRVDLATTGTIQISYKLISGGVGCQKLGLIVTSRKRIPTATERDVLTKSHRRCCLCWYLTDRKDVRKGQICHINRDPSDNHLENLVWLCLDHHDEYDSKTSQSKGLTSHEVKKWRDDLYHHIKIYGISESEASPSKELLKAVVTSDSYTDNTVIARPWRFRGWLTADFPIYFAYTAGGQSDGICLIERVDLPDGRIVIACIQTAGNPGTSITNCVEYICSQVCAQFDIPHDKLVWLENYEHINPQEWQLVTFANTDPFISPLWTAVTSKIWQHLKLQPRAKLQNKSGQIVSKLEKQFAWPPPEED
jgi:hypothetical protein